MTAQAGAPWRPIICENVRDVSDRTLRWAAQLGLDAVALPATLADPEGAGVLTKAALSALVERVGSFGLRLALMTLHNVTPRIILARPGRDEDIEAVIRSIRAAGAAGIPVLDYDFYNHRAVEGYGRCPGRGGAEYVDYDQARAAHLPPLPEVGCPTADETWERMRYFLSAVVPAAEEAGVRLALHPNDPPPPTSRGAAQVIQTFEGMKRLIELVPSPSHGISFCQGSFAEWGVGVVEAIRYFGSRDRMFNIHYRNPRGVYPRYVEPFIDEGDLDMLAAMRAYREVGYRYTLCSDHVPHMHVTGDAATDNLIGRAYNHGYIKAMIQAVNGGHP